MRNGRRMDEDKNVWEEGIAQWKMGFLRGYDVVMIKKWGKKFVYKNKVVSLHLEKWTIDY